MKKIKLTWLLLFTIIMMVTMKLQWNQHNKNVEQGIIPLELAKTQQEALAITKDWNMQGAIINTWVDAFFIIAYTLFLFVAVYRLASMLKFSGNYLKYLAWLAPIAGILDFAENYKMLQFMANVDNFQSAYTVSIIKWGIVAGLFVLFIVLSCLVNDQEMKRNRAFS